MKKTITNNTPILQVVYDALMKPYHLLPGESVEILDESSYVGFESLTMKQVTVGGVLYIGYAQPGTGVAEPGWSIMRVDANNNKAWAGGKFAFNYVWNSMLTYSYS